jgi:hypothetical protein
MPASAGPVWTDLLSGTKPDVGAGKVRLSQVFTGLPVVVLMAEKGA